MAGWLSGRAAQFGDGAAPHTRCPTMLCFAFGEVWKVRVTVKVYVEGLCYCECVFGRFVLL